MLSEMLSGGDIKDVFPYAKLHLYNDLSKYNTINYKQIFDDGELPNFAFVLYQSEKSGNKNIGHWVLLIDKKNSIELFDPYGEELVNQYDEYQGTGTSSLKVKPYLEILLDNLKRIGKKIIINGFPFQKEDENINTCGKWCVIRAYFEDLSLNQFHNLIEQLRKKYNYKDLDNLVDFLYNNLVEKDLKNNI